MCLKTHVTNVQPLTVKHLSCMQVMTEGSGAYYGYILAVLWIRWNPVFTLFKIVGQYHYYLLQMITCKCLYESGKACEESRWSVFLTYSNILCTCTLQHICFSVKEKLNIWCFNLLLLPSSKIPTNELSKHYIIQSLVSSIFILWRKLIFFKFICLRGF